MSKGAEMIAAERERQVTAEGWTQEHDAQHRHGELAKAAACYAVGEPVFRQTVEYRTGGYRFRDERLPTIVMANLWPWESEWYKPKDRISDLVRAGALLAAEIDRLLAVDRSKR